MRPGAPAKHGGPGPLIVVVLLLLTAMTLAAPAPERTPADGSVATNGESVISPAPFIARLLLPPGFLERLGVTEEQQKSIAGLERDFVTAQEAAVKNRAMAAGSQQPEAAAQKSGPPSPAVLAEDLRKTMRELQAARQDEDREAFEQGQERLHGLLQKLAGLREAFEPALFTVLDDEQKEKYLKLKLELVRPGVLFGLMHAGGGEGARPPRRVDGAKLKALTDLGEAEYHGVKGGLYPDGKNERPPAHESAGRALAARVQPLDGTGKPSPKGRIVLLTIGMSNTMQATDGFREAAENDAEINPLVVIVNGAQGGQTAARTQDPADHGSGTLYWKTVDERLANAGVTRAQVQAAWVKQADASPTQGFPEYARTLENELARIMQVLHERFPNLKLVYLSSRTFGGFAKTPLNPEPYAYESGFSVKWLLESQIQGDQALNYDSAKGPVNAPWLSWGPYLWANGPNKRSDGFFYEESDFRESDGTHESPSGQLKVGRELVKFFKTDATTKGWFVVGR